MADDWAPKTREEYVALQAESFKTGLAGFLSDREEAEAKAGKEGDEDKTGKEDKEGKGGGGNGGGKSAIDRLLGF
jgi:hypothetical protein